ncbi:MAG TPA: GNAT family N-acetyltransferase [Novosphingobium sp.]|nr:GNAT family N-acetyltransferase [Novosphingobium sp.]
MNLTVRPLVGADLRAAMTDLARLRISVFSAWPYLYDGELDYETQYLREFLDAPDSLIVAAYDGDRIVGAATASPMQAQKKEFRAPFEQCGIDTRLLFYFGESVLLPEYRGRGTGHAFFDAREAHAAACGAAATTFAAVVRDDDHPAKPRGYVPLDGFWARRGYAPVPGMTTTLAWKELGDDDESPKPLQFWARGL